MRAESLAVEKRIGVPAGDGVGCERPDKLERVDLAGFAEEPLSESGRLDALARRALGESLRSGIIKFNDHRVISSNLRHEPMQQSPESSREQANAAAAKVLRLARRSLCKTM